ncbi:MAG: phosphomethylpyrimidine kinase [Gammaproteobacteria bacterium RIFCSPHIGHO2_12_FULL_42_10]|nr:MAG: phosphomethylpyrimidine kinase [Gammaproteobacteria bacterium RIFCSPHIGHO2_12_FULL_42_10]
MKQQLVWTIAGSDSCGGAGVQADLQTFQAFDARGCSVVTAITAQNTRAISAIHYLPAAVVDAQINTLCAEAVPQAVKIGMLGQLAVLPIIRHFLKTYTGFVVLDPLLVSSSGKNLYEGEGDAYLKHLQSLFPYINLLTPNIDEAEKLLQRKLQSHAEVEQAASAILNMGVNSVLIKGGHAEDQFSQDYWSNGRESCWLSSQRLQRNCHGTGCVLSSAIAANVAAGHDLKDALVIAKMYVNRGIRLANDDAVSLLVHEKHAPEDHIDLPFVSPHPLLDQSEKFNQDGLWRQGLYPVVDSIAWLKKLLPLGINILQLRIKDKTGLALESEIQQAIILAKKYNTKLFINDYWELAIRFGAYGVHLGQDDLPRADLNAIRAAGLRLGISTHCYYEVARAHACQPSYIACGPIYHTNSKAMAFAPQGITALARWRRTLEYPIVAIGGIHLDNLDAVMATGVDAVALISAITAASDPVNAAQQLLMRVNDAAA